MGNLSKELRNIFFESLLNKKNSISSSSYSGGNNSSCLSYRQGSFYNQLFNGGGGCSTKMIYFYEWSNLDSLPKKFFTMAAFETFLHNSNLVLLGYQKDIISNLPNAHVICKKNSSELVIGGTYILMSKLFNDDVETLKLPFVGNSHGIHGIGAPNNNPPSSSKEPYNVAVTRRPPMYNEGGYDGHWYG